MRPLNFFFTFILAAVLCGYSAAQPVVVEHSVKFSESVNATLVGEDGVIMNTTDNGQTWVEQTSGVTNVLYGFSPLDLNTSYAAGENGVILKTIDAGLTWTALTSGVTVNLNDIEAVDSNYVVVCGDLGTLLVSADNGATWTAVDSTITNNLQDIYFIDENIGFVTGDNSAFYKTTDKGLTWILIDLGLGSTVNINAIFARNENVMTIVGDNGMILNSVDGGLTWTEPVNDNVVTVLNDVVLFGTSEGIIVGNDAVVLKTIDGGLTWTNATPNMLTVPHDFYSVSFSSDLNGILVGENGMEYYTADGGSTWTEMREPAYSAVVKKISATNYPNPFNPSTKISFQLPNAGNLTVAIYDITGREVARLFDGYAVSGTQEFNFNASNLSSGVYFYRIQTEAFSVTNKMILTK